MTQLAPDRRCAWCDEPLPAHARKDAETCSRSCRQARHRFRIAPARDAAGATPLSFAYADPPYPGLARRYYGDDPRCAEVDHEVLIADLCQRFPDGWALSTSAAALRDVLALCPRGVRVAIWVKGSRSGESWRARNAYEPVIIWGGRPTKLAIGDDLDDVLIWGGRQHSHPGALVGMKPAPFAEWLFRQLGALAGDYLTDVFPGSGAVMRAWKEYGGRDPDEQATTAAPRLPFEDIISAPPTGRNKIGSRLEEASAKLDASLVDERPIVIRIVCPRCDAPLERERDEAGDVWAVRCSSCSWFWKRSDYQKPSEAAARDDSCEPSDPAGAARQLDLLGE